MADHHAVVIYWSAADDAFIAAVPELEGCMAHGPTRESALANAQGAIAAWLATAKEFGDPIPEPRQRTVLAA